MTESTFAIPDGFLMGASTSAHQIEGNNTASDWWALETMPGSPIPEPSGPACNSYQRWRDDMDLLAGAGLNAYRFSIEWARIEPERGVIDTDQVEHYRQMVLGARERGLTPVITLHHFTSPAWFAAAGGWLAQDAPELFAHYVSAVAPVIDAGAAYVVTINEPNIAAVMHRVLRGEVSLETLGGGLPDPDPTVRDVLIDIHQRTTASIRQRHPDVAVGWSVANQCVEWIDGGQQRAEEYRDTIEDAFLRAAEGDDFIGVQAYTRTVFDANGIVPPAPEISRTLTGWENYPAAVGRAAAHTAAVVPGVPIVVTENGIATDNDADRIAYTTGALAGLAAAMRDGVDVRGYLHWSLLDNYEWGHWGPTFGLVSVDRDSGSFARVPKPSLAWLGEVAQSGRLPGANQNSPASQKSPASQQSSTTQQSPTQAQSDSNSAHESGATR